MTNSSGKTDKLINYIPIISGIALIYFGASVFNYSDPADIFLNNGIFSLAYPLLFMFMGYKYGLTQNDEALGSTVVSQLKHVGIFYGFVAVASLAGSLASEGASAFRQILLIFTGGVPAELWFVPAGVIAILFFRALRKKTGTETIVKISALLFALSLLITTYSGFMPFLNTVKTYTEAVFVDSHCGAFSAMLFVSLGVKLSEKGTKRKTRTLAFGVIASFVLILIEIVVLSLRSEVLRSPLFFLASVPASISIFSLFLKAPNVSKGFNSADGIGSAILFVGQLLCSVCNSLTAGEGFLFAKLFSSTSEKFEVILLLTLIISFAVQAFLGKTRWADTFAYYVESAIAFVLRPLAYVMTAVGTKIKNVVLVIAFGALPVLVWFFEREIGHSLCSDIFAGCLVAIVLCSLSYPLNVNKKNGTAFSLLLFTSVMLYLSAKLFDVYTYGQVGKMLLYFFVPLATIISNRKDFLPELFKNYTAGIYLSFSAFVTYCLMFRPYDITRYKGAFCNANMCGLYLVVVCAIALCNLPNKFDKKDFSKNLLHWTVFGTAFGFVLFTISRTAFVGAAAAVFVKVCAVAVHKREKNSNILQKTKTFFVAAVPFAVVILAGLTLSYVSIRFIPGLIDRPTYLINEVSDQMQYKVIPGAGLLDENYISPLRFLQAWTNRTVSGYESVDDLSTGRITIYRAFLKEISFSGHMREKMYIEGEALPMLAHNAFLQAAYNCGVIAGVIYLAYCIFCIAYGSRRYLKKDDFSLYSVIAMAAYVVCGMFESMEAYYFPLFFIALFGILPLVCTDQDQLSQSEETRSEWILGHTKAKQRTQKVIAITVILALCIGFAYLVFVASSNPNVYILNEMLK